jgi:hypothetical protein
MGPQQNGPALGVLVVTGAGSEAAVVDAYDPPRREA